MDDGRGAGRRHGNGGDGGDEDIDARFAAMMEGLDLDDALAPGAAAQGAAGQSAPREDGVSDPAEAEAGAAGPKAVKVAVVLTPIAKVETLAGLCAMSDLDCTVVPASTGALAVKEFVSAHAQWDVAELLGGIETEPAEAAELAGSLSRFSRGGAILLTADLATDVGIEKGLSGTITARRYDNGAAGEEASAGLLLAGVDQVVEDILLGVVRAEDVRGAVRTTEVRPGGALRWLGRGLRRTRGQGRDGGAEPGDPGEPGGTSTTEGGGA
ncbi:hypothetical protein [Actinomyces howellii]|uniref:Uncharacterized protein n=1 Tax=Actinomyces howellii TaxID=52771 RepID=A0A448HF13_9ACTO|nr:hypothetical protein [Actinomyces howellii]VEG26801.1 Uncharacterised protein [Actinomyces howellii]